jgi:DNA-binding transcriptional MerR regulator
MPVKEKTIGKLYWSIGEVATELGVNTSLVRYWEKEFGTIRPKRTNRGDRLYTSKEIEQLKRIKHLVKDQGFTLNGAKARLKRDEEGDGEVAVDPSPQARDAALRDRLETLRAALLELRDAL